MSERVDGWTDNEDLDMDNVSTEPPPPPEPGVYAFECVNAQPEKTKTGKPKIKAELTLTASYGQPEGSMSRKIGDHIVVERNTAFRLKQLAVATSVQPPAKSEYGAIAAFCDELQGKSGFLAIRHEIYNNRKQVRVARYFISEAQAKEAATGGDAAGEAGTTEVKAPPARKRR